MKSFDILSTPLTPAVPLTPEDRKLQAGAHEFESMMLGELLKPLHFSGAPGQDGEEAEGGANGTLASFGTEAVAKAIAAHGGFGIATKIIGQVSAERDQRPQPTPGTKV